MANTNTLRLAVVFVFCLVAAVACFGEPNVRNAKGSPWFAYVAFNSPHRPTYTEPECADNYRDQGFPKSPEFDEEDVSDKPQWIRSSPASATKTGRGTTAGTANRLRAMRSVNDAIAGLLRSLRETEQIDNTYVVLWNDNGYHIGQHRIPEGKRTVYEEDVRYPMVVRGPGVGHDAKDERLVSGADLNPTFLELAGGPTPEYVDGRSLVPLFSGSELPWREALLLEGYDDGFGNKPYIPPDFPHALFSLSFLARPFSCSTAQLHAAERFTGRGTAQYERRGASGTGVLTDLSAKERD
jgi:arylsulfatase A-like enzyme